MAAPPVITQPHSRNAFARTVRQQVYDYIFAGAGCATLSTIMHLLQSGALNDKKVLLIDSDSKQRNDRTWCFWESGEGLFEPIVYKRWQQLQFYADRFSGPLAIAPYTYKLIRGIDFYTYCLNEITQHANIELLQASVQGIAGTSNGALVQTDSGHFEACFLFNSIPPQKPALQPHQYFLLQHFKGWMIETDSDAFDAGQATLMDFRVGQSHGATFVYVLPITPRKAFVEYTLFSKELLPQSAYDKALQQYIHQYLGIEDYRVVEKEFGVIPMTNASFPQPGGNIMHIGTAGGYTKASSGYTFSAIQKAAAQISAGIQKQGRPIAVKATPARFHFFDSVLLHILHHNQLRGADVFAQLFQKNKGADVLRFLDNEANMWQELRIISSLPKLPFSKAAGQYLAAKFLRR